MSDEVRALEHQIQELKTRLAQARRSAPPSEPIVDYAFALASGGTTTLSSLFAGKRDLLIIHNMGRKCPYCTLWADGLNGIRRHLENRAGLALCSPDSPAVQKDFAALRAWGFRMVSPLGNSFIKDMGFEGADGDVGPGVSAFRLGDDGAITRVGSAGFGPGDNFCAAWHLFDLLRDGSNGWEPKYAY